MPLVNSFGTGLQCRPVQADGRVLFSLSGEINGFNCVLLADHVLRRWSDQPGATALELDMAAVHLIDSKGLQMMIALSAELAEAGGQLRVVRPSLPVRRVLQLAGIGGSVGVTPAPS